MQGCLSLLIGTLFQFSGKVESHFTWIPFFKFARNLKKCSKYNTEADGDSGTIPFEDNKGEIGQSHNYR